MEVPMKRRGSSFCTTEMAKAIQQFSPGDIVLPLFMDTYPAVHGVVTAVRPKEHKVYVSWGNVTEKQHDPDEIQPADLGKISGVRRMAGRAKEVIAVDEEDPQFVGDPKTHGVEKPRPGGFTIMQRLVKDLHKESLEEAKEGPRTAKLRSRRAVYHRERGRVYKRTRYEIQNGVLVCPRCRGEAERQPFTKSVKIYICPDCGWKITTDKVL
jgi:hypothetical protein